MNILIIESSTDIELLAVESDGNIFQFVEKTGLSHSTFMFENIGKLLESAGLNIREIDLIGVGTGPGSFTGVRIAVSTARMLSQLLSIPLVGVKTHDIYAASYGSSPDKIVAVAFDAKKSRIFGGLYRNDNRSIPETLLTPCDITINELIMNLPETGKIVCIGDGFKKYFTEIKDYSLKQGIDCIFPENFIPSGKAASLIVKKKFMDNPEVFKNYSCTLPSYERLSDAEQAVNKK